MGVASVGPAGSEKHGVINEVERYNVVNCHRTVSMDPDQMTLDAGSTCPVEEGFRARLAMKRSFQTPSTELEEETAGAMLAGAMLASDEWAHLCAEIDGLEHEGSSNLETGGASTICDTSAGDNEWDGADTATEACSSGSSAKKARLAGGVLTDLESDDVDDELETSFVGWELLCAHDWRQALEEVQDEIERASESDETDGSDESTEEEEEDSDAQELRVEIRERT